MPALALASHVAPSNVVDIQAVAEAWRQRIFAARVTHQKALDLIEAMNESAIVVDIQDAIVVSGQHPTYGSITVVQTATAQCCVTSRDPSIQQLSIH